MEGYARKAIAQELNKERIPNPKDSLWRDIDIRRIITEEAFRGRVISTEAFDAAQAIREKRTKAHHYRKPYEGMFGGIITCGSVGTRPPTGREANQQIGYAGNISVRDPLVALRNASWNGV